MEMVSLESEYKRMTAEIKELRELLGEVNLAFTDPYYVIPEDLISRIQQKLNEAK